MILFELLLERHQQGQPEAGGAAKPAELGPTDPGRLAGGVGSPG
jgi:hypothetical protein